MSIDWFGLAMLGVAYAFGQFARVSLAVKNAVYAAACFAVVGWRLRNGVAGANTLMVLIVGALGGYYLLEALKTRKN